MIQQRRSNQLCSLVTRFHLPFPHVVVPTCALRQSFILWRRDATSSQPSPVNHHHHNPQSEQTHSEMHLVSIKCFCSSVINSQQDHHSTINPPTPRLKTIALTRLLSYSSPRLCYIEHRQWRISKYWDTVNTEHIY